MVSRLPRGAQRRHLAKAKWLRTKKLLNKFLRILHALGQRPGEFNKPLVLGSRAAWGNTLLKKTICVWTWHLFRAAGLPEAELFIKNQTFFEEATCPGQLRSLPAAELLPEI